MKLSGIFTIRDGIYLGYPFLEAILSILPIVDEFLISDGGSKDGTFEALKKLRRTFPKKIIIYQDIWFKSECWETIDEPLNRLIKKAKGDWLIEAQGDEIWHENNLPYVQKIIKDAHNKKYNSVRQPRLDCTFTQIYNNYVYKNVRIVRNIPNLKSNWGGDDFQIGESRSPKEGYTSHNVPPELEIETPYYHFVRVFPKNNPRAAEVIANEIAPKNTERIDVLEENRKVDWKSLKAPLKKDVLNSLPILIKGLSQELEYKVRKEVFDRKWLSKTTGLKY